MHVHLWHLYLVDQSFTTMHTPESTSMVLARVKILILTLMNVPLLTRLQAILISSLPSMWMLLKKNVIRNLYLALFPLLFHLQAISFVLSALFQLAYLCIYISYQQALFSFFHHPVPSTYFRIHKDVFYCIIMILVVSSCARFEKWLIPPNQHS